MTPRPNDTQIAAIATELRVLVDQFKRRFREKVNLGDLTSSQLAVLRRLDSDGPATVTTLARAEGMRPQSMSAVIAEMEAAGLVRGAPDPSDGRRTIISLTDPGWDSIKLSRAERQDWLAHMINAKFSPAEIRQLVSTMALLERLR